MNPYEIVFHPYITEKTLSMIENNNALQFAVKMDANKRQIKEAVEKMFGVKVAKITTKIGAEGKVATVKLMPDYNAEDIGMRIGIF